MKKYGFTLVIFLLITIFLATNNTRYHPSAHASKNSVQSDWADAIKISGDATSAVRPAISSSPNGNTVLVAYSGKSGGENQDPYYSYSDTNGESGSWQMHNIVDSSTSDVSQHIHAAFDIQGYAHLTWREGSRLAYAKSISDNDLGSGFTRFLFDNSDSPDVLNPVVATDESLVHIIWAEKNSVNPAHNIFHIFSQDDGDNWPTYAQKTKISYNQDVLQTESPAAAIDNDGNLHVVYQQQSDLVENRIFYSKGTVSYDSESEEYDVDWSEEGDIVEISHMIDFEHRFDLNAPEIVFNQGRIDVSASYQKIGENEHFIFHFYCTSNCAIASNWKTSGIISGSKLEVNETPGNLTSSIVSVGGCPEVIFDGMNPSNGFNNEQLWNVGRCQSWSNWSNLTPEDLRAIRPAAEMQKNKWWLYVAYEKYVDESTNEVYFMRTRPETAVFLPIIKK